MRSEMEVLAAIEELQRMGDAACLNGHRPDAQALLQEWMDLPLDDDDEEELPPPPPAVDWLWDLLDPPPEPPVLFCPVKWMDETQSLLIEHWGDLDAFDIKEIDESQDGLSITRCVPGPAANQANHLLMQFEHLERREEVDLLLLYRLHSELDNHVDPDRVLANIRRERYAPELPVLERVEDFGPVDEFVLWCEHRRNGWGFGYRAAVNKYGREYGEKYPMTLQESKNFNLECERAKAEAVEKGTVSLAPLVPYTELREAIFEAAVASDENGYNAGLGEMAQRFRKDERKLLPELLRMLRTKYSKRTYRTGEIDIRKVAQLKYALEGFLPSGEVVHLFAPWFCGKTSLCVGMASALITGTGFLDVDIPLQPRSCLFIQTDAGASRFAVELEKQDLLDDPRFVPGPEQMLHIWAPDDAQGVEAWSATFRGLVKLREEAQRLEVGAIFIDSVKGMMSGTGMDYTHNETVNQFVTLLRQTVAQPLQLPVVLINHKGTDQKEGAGAKAWSEACGQVIELAFVTEDKQQLNNVRELIIRKDSIGGPRRFHYKMEDGELRVAMGTEVVKDNSDAVLQMLKTWSLHGTKEFSRKKIMGEDNAISGLSRATKDRALERLCVRGGPLVKIGRGRFKLRQDL